MSRIPRKILEEYQALTHALFGAEVPTEFRDCEAFALIDDRMSPAHFFPFGHCQLVHPRDRVEYHWFGGEEATVEAARRELLIFLEGGEGWLHGIWRHSGQPLLEAPVVYLDDEGVGSSVVAGCLREFLAIAAALGQERVSPDNIRRFSERAPPEAPAEPFFIARHITPALALSKLMERAIATHPNFDAWLGRLRG